MKTVNLVLILASMNPAFASSVPSNATLLFQVTSDQAEAYDATPDKCPLVSDLVDKIQEKELESAQDVGFKCEEVYRVWKTDTQADGNCGAGSVVNGVISVITLGQEDYWGVDNGDCKRDTVIHVEEYCLARDIQQQQILSLQRTCQSQPNENCYKSDFLDYLKDLKDTTYTDIDKPSC